MFFGCPSCNAKFSMVTNPGETQMVSSLGVKLGGRTVRPSLRDDAGYAERRSSRRRWPDGGVFEREDQGGQPAVAAATAAPAAKPGEKSSSGCPFSAMVAEIGFTSAVNPAVSGTATTEFAWSPDAKEKLDRLPSFVKPMVQSSVEALLASRDTRPSHYKSWMIPRMIRATGSLGLLRRSSDLKISRTSFAPWLAKRSSVWRRSRDSDHYGSSDG